MAVEANVSWLRTIRVKIIAVGIITATLVLGVAGFLYYRYTETTKTAELQQLAEVTADRMAQHIEIPMWDVDYEQVGKLLEAEMKEAKIFGIVVRDEDRKTLFAARERRPGGRIVESNGDVTGNFAFARRDVMRGDKAIGAVTVFLSPSFLERELVRFAWGIGLVVVVLDLLMLVFISIALGRVVVTPLEVLARHAERISRGDLRQEIEVRSRDEIGYLATTLNRMQHSLRVAISRLRRR